MKIAFIFAGQGSQYIGMGKELYDNILICREAFDKARSLLDFDIKELMFNGEKEELDITENTQPAILATSIMAMKALEEKKITPSVVAGLSLGEYSALVSANALSFEEAIKLVRKRGRFMQEAVPIGVGSMIAIIGLSLEKIKIAIEEASSIGIVEIANYNTNNQIVIGGEKDAVEKVKELCFEFGARRVIELKVSGPFHTSLLEKASVKLKEELEKIDFNNPKVKIISNVTADFIENKEDIKEILCKQVKSSVRWSESINKMLDMGVDTFIELGPGRVLSGFVKEISREKGLKVNIFNVEDLKSLSKTLEGIGGLND
ncbi:ACP S-malonyltransferase [Clostridium sp. Sa3CUN1]|uniref:Malonyl CoA-acyl carrier protein transacylase n=1 Tax=Clostridium gallinarum TaxID=2762246 RepID=A0ABR8Q7G4_9CLOT|nr:ACP S-malonyltransferase [Clostridium gallinarum]MBD7916368.1 ACP S-malonyltransferase [Clostridium gallinarum]